ncbi:YnbE family lipoprotein [Pelagibius sp. Alg239-R121]|uniref:YnbE family lipoprotein n=1 Tax=Pelagibius sp. Alg239-R121 TaxID=2993448 RepID=UPI0024A689B7|nr:YnbE family lipoprotein [Pelagibius sp. Alg239-R121]
MKGDISLSQAFTLAFNREGPRIAGLLRDYRLVPTGIRFAALTAAIGVLSACQPTVRVEAPKEPITINLNVKLDAEVRLKLEEQAREEVEANPDIF